MTQIKTSWPTWPHYAEDEIQAVVDVLRSGKVNQWTGEQVKLFEREFARSHDCEYGIALANGTVALELALYALDIGPGDEVITTPRTFMASASAIVMRGAKPVFADVDLNSQNITTESIAQVITPKTKAIICVHLAGYPCEMDKIMTLAEKHDLKVIEDCAQAHGAIYQGKHVGSWGHVSAFSFCQDKIMTTGGEGGMLLTQDEELYKKAWAYKDHGKDYDVVFHQSHPPGFRWLHEVFGTNWRMTEMQAAIGLKQLKKLSQWRQQRTAVAEIYAQGLSKFSGIRVPTLVADSVHAHYRYYVFIKLDYLKPGWTRDKIMEEIVAQGVPCFSGSCSEIYLEKCFKNSEFKQQERLPNAKLLGETSLAFLLHPTLNETDVDSMFVVINAILNQAMRS